jgi:hypothetical protein
MPFQKLSLSESSKAYDLSSFIPVASDSSNALSLTLEPSPNFYRRSLPFSSEYLSGPDEVIADAALDYLEQVNREREKERERVEEARERERERERSNATTSSKPESTPATINQPTSPSSHSGSDLWGSPSPPEATPATLPSLYLPVQRNSQPPAQPPPPPSQDPYPSFQQSPHPDPSATFDWTSSMPEWNVDITDVDFSFFDAPSSAPAGDPNHGFSFETSPIPNEFSFEDTPQPFVFSPIDTTTSPSFLLPIDQAMGGVQVSTSPIRDTDQTASPTLAMVSDASPSSTSPTFALPFSSNLSPNIIPTTPHATDTTNFLPKLPFDQLPSLSSLSLVDVPIGYEPLTFNAEAAELERANYNAGKFAVRNRPPKRNSYSSSGQPTKRTWRQPLPNETTSLNHFHRTLPPFLTPMPTLFPPNRRTPLVRTAYVLLSDPKVSLVLRIKRQNRKKTRPPSLPARSIFTPQIPPDEDENAHASPSQLGSILSLDRPKAPSIPREGEVDAFLSAAFAISLEHIAFRQSSSSATKRKKPVAPPGPPYPSTPVSPFAQEKRADDELQAVGRFLAGEVACNPSLREHLLRSVAERGPSGAYLELFDH